MKARSHIYSLFTIVLIGIFCYSAHAQPGFQVDIKKDKPFEERKLKAEKTGEGELKAPKRIFQNLTTRFNYYFNANNKFNDVITRAKAQHLDDFSQLLSFYDYSLDATAADSMQLDSVIYKCRTGIVNHDLRNEWIDELYLLWAASWHLQKKLDSASMMLQFINYAYAPQEDYGFYSYIGTRKEGSKELTIATPESSKFLHSNTFSRNNAFLWQIRTLIELGNFGTSGSLITTLKRDPAFPERLNNALEEMQAYWYYKQKRWDSAAVYLLAAIDGAGTKREKARWHYLAAQLMENAGKSEQASALYAKAISQTSDPVLEVNARLNLVRINKEGGENAIDRNVAELLKMAKRDKYADYRDLIYFMAARMEIERNNIAVARELLLKGAKYNNGNLVLRNKAFLQLADASFNQKKYLPASFFYDSVQVNDLTEVESQRVFQRKGPLQQITENTFVIARQDSLQRIAAMSASEREDYIKKIVKELRKQQGLKEETAFTSGGPSFGQQTDLFTASTKGIWENSNLRAQAASEFKRVWGNRPNVDNWRRFAVVNQQLVAANPMNTTGPNDVNNAAAAAQINEITFESLSAKVPLTPAAVSASNDSIRNALFNLGATYLNELEDYESAITAYEELIRRFPVAQGMDEVLFNLYYAYSKTGNTAKSAQVKKQLQDKFPSSRHTAIVTTGKDPGAKTAANEEATKAYENVYALFIEGKFEDAIAAKALADSTYKTTFWQPQLLYIQAVYHIRQRQDVEAKTALQTIINQNSSQPLTEKAQTLLRVLSRRQQIENELNAYQMQNQNTDTASQKPDLVTRQPQQPPMTVPPPVTLQQPVTVQQPVKKDTIAVTPKVQTTTVQPNSTINTAPVNTTAGVTKPPITPNTAPATKPDNKVIIPPVTAKVDTITKKAAPPKPGSIYTYTPATEHYAVVVLDKVDPVFVTEARNAFFRFNREKYYNQPLDAQTLVLTTDIKLLLISGFTSAQAAIDYAQRAKALAPSDIIPWLKGGKYSFSIISAPNLEILKTTTDVTGYKKFLEQHLPGQF